MADISGIHIIQALRKKWIFQAVFSAFLISVGVAVLLYAVINKFYSISAGWILLHFLCTFLIQIFLRRSLQASVTGITQLLNRDYPVLEESSGLLLKDFSSLNSLEKLQYHKTEEVLFRIKSPFNFAKKIRTPFLVFIACFLAGFIIYKIPFSIRQPDAVINKTVNAFPKSEKRLPQIAAVSITIIPPAYTKKEPREQDRLNLVVEEGARMTWKLNTTISAKGIKLIFNDSAVVNMRPGGAGDQSWVADQHSPASGFYQVNIDGQLSELYKIEIIPDKPPEIHIQSPEQYTTIDFGEPQQVLTRVDMHDDYGVSNASIVATIASGNGEAVKFNEHKIELPGFIAGKTGYQLQKLLSLPQLGLQPGDELYFYVRATDNHLQETRSDIYIIHLPDTAQLMSLDGLANGINLKPEYFRSQRQIIIETEQLLKDKDTISSEAFKNRSNNLGIDQKMLRLRYGKFLGEEDESGVFENPGLDELGDPSNFSNAEKLKDVFTDKHDNAEDATFLAPDVKIQLKATLTEMWNAELRLRTFKPQEALPYEYKALRLLKDLQQKSRAYVAKTSFKTTPIDLQKRLTADLSKIGRPVFQKNSETIKDPATSAREALGELEQLKFTNATSEVSSGILQKANLLLYERALKQPGLYIQSVEAMRQLIDDVHAKKGVRLIDIIRAERGLQQILSAPDLLPSAESENSTQLSKQYFLNLQKKQP